MKTKVERFFARRNTRRWKIMRNIVYSQVLFCTLMILFQIALFLGFVVWSIQFFSYFFGATYLLGIVFVIYLSNCKGKNEFKIAWLIPSLIFPIFGIAFYIFFQTNRSGKKFRSSLKSVKEQTTPLLLENNETKTIIENFTETKDLCKYLLDYGNYPSYINSSVEYLSGGEKFYPDFLEEIKKAKEFIFIEFFIIDADETWLQIVEVLKQKISEGVEVRILYDAVGSVFSATKAHQKFLKDAGIKSKIFLPLIPIFATQQNNRDHRKIIVIDGKLAYTGGLNISEEYFNIVHPRFDYWKDTAVKIKGPAIKTFTTMFLQSWNIFSKEIDDYNKFILREYKNENSKGLLVPYGDDAFNNEDIAENIYIYILNKAQKYVHITTPYVIIDNTLLNAISFAAKRGVDVSIVVPKKPDHFMTFCIGKVFLKTLIDSGVKIYLYDEGFIHAKMFVSDDSSATIGSVNLDYRSLYHHFESGVFIHKMDVINEIETDFQNLKKSSTEMTSESYKKLPLYMRIIGRIGKVFAPLL